jgi:hypothetical protein
MAVNLFVFGAGRFAAGLIPRPLTVATIFMTIPFLFLAEYPASRVLYNRVHHKHTRRKKVKRSPNCHDWGREKIKHPATARRVSLSFAGYSFDCKSVVSNATGSLPGLPTLII